MELKWDIKRGSEVYRSVYDNRLKSWISTGKLKRGEVLVWRSGFSGWRRPEELQELLPFFKEWKISELKQLRLVRRKKPKKKAVLQREKKISDILLIDDEKDLCTVLNRSLTNRGYKVGCVNTKRRALGYLKKTVPDLVFLDLKLPDGDGMKLLSRIKKNNPATIVHIISAYGSEERKEEAKKKGASSFVDKPFTEKDILKVLR